MTVGRKRSFRQLPAYRKGKAVVDYFQSFRISVYSANACFFLLFSLFPILILVLTLISFSPVTAEDLIRAAQRLIPQSFIPMLQVLLDMLENTQSAGFLSITTVTLLWTSSRGTLGLIDGLNAIYRAEEHRNYFWRRILCLGYTLLLLVSLLVMLILYVFSNSVFALFARLGGAWLNLVPVVMSLRHVFSLSLLILFFTLLFVLLPNCRVPLRGALPGAVFCAVAWLLLSYGFSYYVSHFSRYTYLYGSLGTVMLALLWMYLCMYLLFYGGILNQYVLSRRNTARE